MKKFLVSMFAVIAAIAMSLAFIACSGAASVDPDSYAFVTIDINPSVELVTLGGNIVEVKAANYDACVLLDGEDLSQMTVESATEHIVSLAEQMGYLNSSNNQVKITVVSDNAQTVEILKSAAKSGAEKGSKIAVTSAEPRIEDEITLKKLKEEKPDKFAALTEEKLRLIESVMEHDENMTYETGAGMTVNELSESLKAALDEDRDIFTAGLHDEYSQRYAAAKQAIAREIAAVHGEEYLAAWDNYTALKNVYDDILTALEKSGLSDEDAASVKTLIGLTDISQIQKGGIVRSDYVLNYIDKHINKKGDGLDADTVSAVTAILDKYDPANYILTEDEAAAVAAVAPNGEYTALNEVSAAVAEFKATLDAIGDSIHLSDEQIERIRVLKAGYENIKDSVLEEMQGVIAEARAEIAAAKEERVNA